MEGVRNCFVTYVDIATDIALVFGVNDVTEFLAVVLSRPHSM